MNVLERRENELNTLALAVQIANLKQLQVQRKISDRRLENHLGVRHGTMQQFYRGEEGYEYLIDRVDLAITRLSRKERRMAYADRQAQAELERLRKTGEWVPAEQFLALVETSRGGYLHQHVMYEKLMEELPFYGDVEEDA